MCRRERKDGEKRKGVENRIGMAIEERLKGSKKERSKKRRDGIERTANGMK